MTLTAHLAGVEVNLIERIESCKKLTHPLLPFQVNLIERIESVVVFLVPVLFWLVLNLIERIESHFPSTFTCL